MLQKEVIVKATVSGTKLFETDNRKTFLINLDKPYPNSPLTVVMFDGVFEKFKSQLPIEGKTIIVKGAVSEYKGRPQIDVKDLKNIEVIPKQE